MSEQKTNDFLTVQEVASRLRVNEATVRRWIKNGSLAAIKLPHRGKREIYRVRRSTIQTVLKEELDGTG
jgi:excisionase family DNA binding protein